MNGLIVVLFRNWEDSRGKFLGEVMIGFEYIVFVKFLSGNVCKCMGDGERGLDLRIIVFKVFYCIEVWCKRFVLYKEIFFVWSYIYDFIFLNWIYIIIKFIVLLVEKVFYF